MAADAANLVLALDYRGHGQSEYDRNPDNYALPVALADLAAVLIALETAPAIFIGTSYGGFLLMMLAAWRPPAIAGVILNDIGPVIEPQGWVRIKGYVGKLPVPRNFEEGADILRWWFDAQFPKLTRQEWDRVCSAHLAPTRRPAPARLRSEAGADAARRRSATSPDAMESVCRLGAGATDGYSRRQVGYAGLDHASGNGVTARRD
jgi:pimeloyl-ACP methyl ester carboxylesterase